MDTLEPECMVDPVSVGFDAKVAASLGIGKIGGTFRFKEFVGWTFIPLYLCIGLNCGNFPIELAIFNA
jgi:hypothetical protein